MVVTHLFQLAAEVAMEPPLSLDAADLQDARESVISAFRPLAPEDVVLGQYDGYLETEGIAPGSTQNTFAAVRLWIDTDRWHGVPFLLRTGKLMAESKQQVSLIFRAPEGPLGSKVPALGNVLTVDISGSGQVDLRVVAKKPGPALDLTTDVASLPLASANSDPLPPYVRLISDVILGDRSLFTRPDGLGHAWDAVRPILDAHLTPLPYPAHSWGPAAATDLAGPEGWLLGG
jgi:glucose-6-phosphate 1-dehydrogenase